MPALRELARRPRARRRDHEPAEAVLVAAPRDLRRRPATTRTNVDPDPTPVRRARGARAAPAARCRRRDRRSTRSATPRRRSRTRAGRRSGEARLADTDRVATRDDLGRAAVVAHHDARRVPRHVGQVPLVPREPRSVGRPGRIPRVVGRRAALRPRAAVERDDGDVARVVALDRRTRPRLGPRPPARSARPSRREHADDAVRRAARRRSGRRRRRRRARRRTPRRSRRRSRCPRSRPPAARPSAGATTRSARPSCAAIQARRAPVGDQRGSATEPERATIAGVITAANATERRETPASRARAALGRPPGLPPGLAPPSWALHACAPSRRRCPRPGDPLRIAFLIYRGNPHCGGQGVYSRHLTRELDRARARGHDVRRASRGRSPTRP